MLLAIHRWSKFVTNGQSRAIHQIVIRSDLVPLDQHAHFVLAAQDIAGPSGSRCAFILIRSQGLTFRISLIDIYLRLELLPTPTSPSQTSQVTDPPSSSTISARLPDSSSSLETILPTFTSNDSGLVTDLLLRLTTVRTAGYGR